VGSYVLFVAAAVAVLALVVLVVAEIQIIKEYLNR